jgi:hypothetical protein
MEPIIVKQFSLNKGNEFVAARIAEVEAQGYENYACINPGIANQVICFFRKKAGA